jgi:hypothetical protein
MPCGRHPQRRRRLTRAERTRQARNSEYGLPLKTDEKEMP